jgi:hypothetical protein
MTVISAEGREMRRVLDSLVRRIDILPMQPSAANLRITPPTIVKGKDLPGDTLSVGSVIQKYEAKYYTKKLDWKESIT